MNPVFCRAEIHNLSPVHPDECVIVTIYTGYTFKMHIVLIRVHVCEFFFLFLQLSLIYEIVIEDHV
jgi:hypothetical protein